MKHLLSCCLSTAQTLNITDLLSVKIKFCRKHPNDYLLPKRQCYETLTLELSR